MDLKKNSNRNHWITNRWIIEIGKYKKVVCAQHWPERLVLVTKHGIQTMCYFQI
jgi:hypothetical protein